MSCHVRLLGGVFAGWFALACHEVPVALAASGPLPPQKVLFVGDSYLTATTACTMFGALHGQSPVGLAYTADLSETDASYLQRAAWQTLQALQDRSR